VFVCDDVVCWLCFAYLMFLMCCWCVCVNVFFACVSEVCVRCVFGGCVSRLFVCVCLREMWVGVGVVVGFPFCRDGSEGVAGVFVCVSCFFVSRFFVFLFFWLFLVGIVCFCFVFCTFFLGGFDCEM